MALIKCPECGKEISDKAGICPSCGCPIVSENLGNNIDVPQNNAEQQTGTESENISDEVKILKKGINKKILFSVLGLIVVICIGAIGIIVNRNHQIKEQQKAERLAQQESIKEYNKAVDYLNMLYSTTLSSASDAESVCVLVLNVWQDAIYGDSSDETRKYVSGTSDFNEALQKVYDDEEIQTKLNDIKSMQSKADTYIQGLQTSPEELSKAYDAALQLHTSFSALANLSLQPAGNYNSYSESEKSKVDSFMNDYKTLSALIPVKKIVPLYDESGNEIEDEFEFELLMNQKPDQLPDSVDDSLTAFGYYKEKYTLCGVYGEIAYNSKGGVINSITWDYDKPNEIKDSLLEKMSNRYGTPTESDGNYVWQDEDSNISILLKIESDRIAISMLSLY